MGVGHLVTSAERCGPCCRYEEENFVRLPTRRKASASHHQWSLQCMLQHTNTFHLFRAESVVPVPLSMKLFNLAMKMICLVREQHRRSPKGHCPGRPRSEVGTHQSSLPTATHTQHTHVPLDPTMQGSTV